MRAIATPGHTPGHTSYLVGSGKQQFLVLGDVTNIPVLFVKNPGWHAVFDSDAALAETNRRKMMDRAIADKLTVAGYHYNTDDDGAGNFKKLAEQFDKEIWNSEAQATFGNSAIDQVNAQVELVNQELAGLETLLVRSDPHPPR